MTSVVQKNLIIGYLFSITNPFEKFKESFYFFLFIWAFMDYVQWHISRLNKVDVWKSPRRVDFAFIVILNASGY